ncbi:MAG: hypothetical protein LH613_02725 [Chamaesiphon sp.]|nr:hypothetical protein [Chamaesiphon sp.]
MLPSAINASQQDSQHPAQRNPRSTNMGGSEAYIGSVTLQWLADRVKLD